MRAGRDSGQALVESALVLPMVLFCVLGSLQLFMLLQARILAEYAVFRAVRAGSLNHGDCEVMTDAALVSLLPALERTNTPEALRAAFKKHKGNRYSVGHQGQVLELWREEPKAREVPEVEDKLFDQPATAARPLVRLEARMVFWVPLQIPFADWVLQRIFLAHWKLQEYDAANPMLIRQARAGWPDEETQPLNQAQESWPGGPLDKSMLGWEAQGARLFPIQVNFGMRMMTPAKKKFWQAQGCAL
jgi:hypothetical protein